MNQSEIPKDLRRFKKVDFSPYFTDMSDKDMRKELALQQERIATYDLPKDVKQDPLLTGNEPTGADAFIEKNFDREKLDEDFSTLFFTLYASPVSWESLNEQRNMNYGFRAYNKGSKYDLDFKGDFRESNVADRKTKESISTTYKNVRGIFTLKDFAKDWDYFAYAGQEQYQQGGIHYYSSLQNIGLIGFRYQAIKDDNEDMKISFIPMTDIRTFDDKEDNYQSETTRKGARLAFNIDYTAEISKLTTFAINLWWRPYLELGEQKVDWEDTRTDLKATFSRKLSESFSLEYAFQYLKDINFSRDFEVEDENTINSINFRLDFDL